MEPRDAIVHEIHADGPIGFDRYMELALYGPNGYFERPPIGTEGDFVTSPHVHPVFAELLARAIRQLDLALGSPRPLRIAEAGAGDGTLATQLLSELADLDLRYLAVERSGGAMRAIEDIAASASDRLEVGHELEGPAHVVIANELLDNLPFRLVRTTDASPAEVRVELDDVGRLCERLAPLPTDDHPHDALDGGAPGTELIDAVGARDFVRRLPDVLAGHGYALLIDYGDTGGAGGPAHGYRSHRPVEIDLDRPGETDLTAGVDFGAIAQVARTAGLEPHGPVSQHDALRALGFDAWARTRLDEQHRHLDERRGLEAARTWGDRSRATILVDPTALGRHRWLLLATPGLPAPAWINGR